MVKTELYVMPKPECGKFLTQLEECLNNNNFFIKKIYAVKDWETVARSIYLPKLGGENKNFVLGFESHAWVLKNLFGNRALVLKVDKDENSSLDNKLRELYNAKESFRDKMIGGEGRTYVVCINTDRIQELRAKGKKGILGVDYHGKFKTFNKNYNGSWDYVYFKYVHCPDPSLKLLKREWAILNDTGIISPLNLVNFKDWNLMKKTGSMIPFSEVSK